MLVLLIWYCLSVCLHSWCVRTKVWVTVHDQLFQSKSVVSIQCICYEDDFWLYGMSRTNAKFVGKVHDCHHCHSVIAIWCVAPPAKLKWFCLCFASIVEALTRSTSAFPLFTPVLNWCNKCQQLKTVGSSTQYVIWYSLVGATPSCIIYRNGLVWETFGGTVTLTVRLWIIIFRWHYSEN